MGDEAVGLAPRSVSSSACTFPVLQQAYSYRCSYGRWPPLDWYNGKANLLTLALHLARASSFELSELWSPIHSLSLCLFYCLHPIIDIAPPTLLDSFTDDSISRAPVFSVLHCYDWVG